MMTELPKRKSTRFPDYDYNTAGAYFITICTKERKNILSRIVGDGVLDVPRKEIQDAVKIDLMPFGVVVEKYIEQLAGFYDNCTINEYVIMPNHVHMMLVVNETGQSGTPVPTRENNFVSRFISTLKRFINREIGENIFQRSYYDHVIRDKDDYIKHVRYIIDNPIKWKVDELFTTDSLT